MEVTTRYIEYRGYHLLLTSSAEAFSCVAYTDEDCTNVVYDNYGIQIGYIGYTETGLLKKVRRKIDELIGG